MFDYIRFSNCSWPSFNLSEKVEFILIRQVGLGQDLFHQLTNIHNTKVEFSIIYHEKDELISFFQISRGSIFFINFALLS